MRYRYKKRARPNQEIKATDILYREMIFWSKEGKNLVQSVYDLVLYQDAKWAKKVRDTFKDINDKSIDIADKLAPYQSPKLSAIKIDKTTTRKFVIEAPKTLNLQAWTEQVEQERKLLTKPILDILNGKDTDAN